MKLTCNGAEIDAPDAATISDLLMHLEIDPLRSAVEVNRQLEPREKHADHILAAGDVIEIVTLVGGG